MTTMSKPEGSLSQAAIHRSNSSLDRVNPFRVMTVMHRAAELEAAGRRIIHMEVGEPDFTTAEPIKQAAKQALDQGYTRYTQAPGIPLLRERLASYYAARYGVSVDPARILITPGASSGLMLLAHLLVEPGSEVLISDPAYPCVRNFIHLVHGTPTLVPVGPDENFQPTVQLLEQARTPASSGVWLASPANPTGTILDRQRLTQLCHWARDNNLHMLVDEIYHGLHYVSDLPCVLEIDPEAFVVNSFSKYFGMTGWRLGWIVVPEHSLEKANILAQNLYISAPSIAQYAALAAFEPEAQAVFEQRREAFRQRRDYLSSALRELGFELPDSVQGAFYIYADISRFSDNAEQFCRDLLEQSGVAITPGTDFGEHHCQRFVRFAFTTGLEDLKEGVARMRKALC